MKRKIAILSNVNMNSLIRTMKGMEEFIVYEPEGFGNELGLLLNPSSSYHAFGPEVTFMWMDLMEVIAHELDKEVAIQKIKQWFETFSSTMETTCTYFISDAYLWGVELQVMSNAFAKGELEQYWNAELSKLEREHSNVFVLEYHRLVETLGEKNTFSEKMWYMGKILHTGGAQEMMQEEMIRKIGMLYRTPKKVLVLDLDHTLWGGLAGEHDKQPVELSDDHKGLGYKNLQRVIKRMKESGVMLGIASKNNEQDAMDIINNHPHMVLREADFVSKKINWSLKADNLREMARELNVGLDSFVFYDDSDVEREQIKQMLPDVIVPDFPEKTEDLAHAMVSIYETYFKKLKLTEEDKIKTKQYAENALRKEVQDKAVDFKSYLQQLQMSIVEENPVDNKERLLQLLGKTNQFNLITRRYEPAQINSLLEDGKKQVHIYRVEDKFGDYGIVAIAILHIEENKAIIEDFVMSCRVMGRNVENYIIDQLEEQARVQGCEYLHAQYVSTPKNMPVAQLYDKMGYELLREQDGEKYYRIKLEEKPQREYYIKNEV